MATAAAQSACVASSRSLIFGSSSSPKESARILTSGKTLSLRCTAAAQQDKEFFSNVSESAKKCALGLAAAALVALPIAESSLAVSQTAISNPAISELAVLITGPPEKDARALLKNALPISNQPIREVQQSLEMITEELRLPGLKAIDGIERRVRQANRVLNQNRDKILADVAPAKKDEAIVLIDKLQDGLQEFQTIVENKQRALVSSKQKEVLAYVGDIQEAMVASFPFKVPDEFDNLPQLLGRATVEMTVKLVGNKNLDTVKFDLVVDGYNAPVTAGNFVDLVQRKFYDGMEIQRADGFVVQTGDPEGPAEGFVDPDTGKLRNVPLELYVQGDKAPVYHETLEELGRYKAQVRIPFNAFGTMAMAREEFDNDSASSQIFWLLKESELTPSNANILDGRYAVFGYIVENQDLLADLKVGDVITSMKVRDGLDNLRQPTK